VKPLILLILAATLLGCERRDYFVGRGPAGFTTEKMAVPLSTIPHERVFKFDGHSLILQLASNDIASLYSDPRFRWRRAKPEIGSYQIADHVLLDGAKHEVYIDQRRRGATVVPEEWCLFALDRERGLLVMTAEHWRFFEDSDLDPPRVANQSTRSNSP